MRSKSKLIGIVLAIVMLASVPLHSMFVGASELPPPPHFEWLSETQTTYAQEGDEIVISFEKDFLTSQGWNSAGIFFYYDSDVLELIPYGYCPFFLNWGVENLQWIGIDIFAPWYGRANVLTNAGGSWRTPGQISFNVMGSGTDDIPYSITMSLRFKVIEDAPIGMTTVSWRVTSSASWERLPNGQLNIRTLQVVQPTNECFVHVMIIAPGAIPPPPHFVWNVDTQVTSAISGDEIVVSFDMEFLTSQGWNSTQIILNYDSDVLELIPYGYCQFMQNFGVNHLLWIGRDFLDPWYGHVNILTNVGGAWYQPGQISFIAMGRSTADINYPIQISFRFRVRDNAPSGMTTISWNPHSASSWTRLPNGQMDLRVLTVVQPTDDCFVHIMVNPGEWVNAPGVGWVFVVAGNRHMGWLVWEGDKFFMNPNNGGAMVTSPTFYIDGEFHTFNPDGRWQGVLGYIDGEWINVPGVGWVFYVEATGVRHFGWLRWEGQVFRVSPALVSNGTVLIDGVWHQFNSAGWWLGSL